MSTSTEGSRSGNPPAADTMGRSPLLVMTQTTPTCLWNDSATPRELQAAIGWGAVGATCNPVIALAGLRADLPRWTRRILGYATAHPRADESAVGWQLVRELSADAARLLEPVFAGHGGRNGRLSVQTDPRLYRDGPALLEQAAEFAAIAPNIIVKIPATECGITAIEEATYRGISINATVSFTVSQAVAVGEAVERGLTRREAEGLDVSAMGPVCTLMVGRFDDWLKLVAERDSLTLNPGHLEWAGIAVFKKAYSIYRERKFRARLLSAAFRNHMHWSELIGGDIVISPPFSWQVRLNNSGIEPRCRIDDPVDPAIVSELYDRIEDFRRGYDEEGLSTGEFLSFGPSRRTLRQFLRAVGELEWLVRDTLLPEAGR